MNSRLYRLISPKTCSIKLKIMWQKLSQNMKRVMLIQRIWFLACSTFPMSNSQKITAKHVLLTRSKFPQRMWSNFPHGLIKYAGAEHPCYFHYFLHFKNILVQIKVHRRNSQAYRNHKMKWIHEICHSSESNKAPQSMTWWRVKTMEIRKMAATRGTSWSKNDEKSIDWSHQPRRKTRYCEINSFSYRTCTLFMFLSTNNGGEASFAPECLQWSIFPQKGKWSKFPQPTQTYQRNID